MLTSLRPFPFHTQKINKIETTNTIITVKTRMRLIKAYVVGRIGCPQNLGKPGIQEIKKSLQTNIVSEFHLKTD